MLLFNGLSSRSKYNIGQYNNDANLTYTLVNQNVNHHLSTFTPAKTFLKLRCSFEPQAMQSMNLNNAQSNFMRMLPQEKSNTQNSSSKKTKIHLQSFVIEI